MRLIGMMRLILVLALFALPSFAQIRVGAKAGVPLTAAVEATGSFEALTSRWTVGPVVELDLPAGVGVEFNALYRRNGYQSSTFTYEGNTWEFPVLIKYKFPGAMARPYISGGWAFRHISDIPALVENGSNGFVFGFGVRLNAFVLKISPEVRYTRWTNTPVNIQGPASSVTSNRNQFDVLLGVTF